MLRRILLAATGLIAFSTLAIWGASAWNTLHRHWQISGANRVSVHVANHTLLLLLERASSPAGTTWLEITPDLGFYGGMLSFWFVWDAPATYPPAPGKGTYTILAFPLWLPLLLTLAYPGFVLISRTYRSLHRKSRGRCRQCGYNLTGNASGVCPECGTPR